MADVKKIKLPDNSVVNIKDYRIPGVDTVPTSGSGNVITSGGIYAANYAGSDSNGGPALKTYGIPYGAVDSTSTATVITATVDNFPTELRDGVCAYIRNDIIASASGWTLNVNGTGAKPVYASNADATRVETLFNAASTYLFVYNSTRVSGGCWDIYYGYNSNDNTIGYNLRTNAATAPTKSKFYRYRILFTSPDGQYLIPSNTSTSTNATATRNVNQDKIDPFGPIWYYSSTTAVEANASASASYLWLQNSGITLGYSFNRTGATLTLTAKDPVYIKCAPQTDGSAIIDADTPFVQSLPSTEDGKIYIFLGYADSATAITLYYWHPVYYYKDNAIRLWTNAADTTITVDTELSLQSDNPISNAAVTQVIFDNEQVTSAALNDLNNRTLALEESGSTDDGTKQRYVLGTSEEGVGDMNAYIASSIPDPQEGDIFIPYDTNKRFPITSQQTTISFDDYQQQGWPASTATFIQYLVREGRSDYLEIVSDSSGSYRFYGSDVASSEYQYPSVEITLTNSDLCDDGKYRQKFLTWVNGFMYLYYTGTIPNVTLSRCLYDHSGEWEYYNGEWINREGISTKTHERLVTSIMQDDTAYPSANAVYEELKNYSKTLEVYEKYTSDNPYDTTVKDSPLTFSYIANVSNSTTSIYFRCSTTSTTAKTVQVSTGDGTWTDKTPNVQDSDGTYYVLLGTLTQLSPILQVKGSNISYGDSTNYCKFHVDGPCYMYGDLISLVGGHTGTNNNDISDNVYNGNYTFPYMFKDEVNLYSHPTKQLYLITQRVAKNAYYGMFYGCENIVKSPIIDANTYNRNFSSQMFFNCPNMKIFLGGPQLSLDYYTKQGITNTGGHYSYIIGNFYNDADKLLGDIVCASYNSTRDISNWYGLVSDIVTKQNSILFEELRKYVIWDSSSAQFTLSPNKINNLGTLDNSTARVFILKEDNWTGIHHYFWMFETGATPPTITWPSGLTWPEGNPPTLKPNHHYEISVLNNIVAWMEV